MVKQFMVYDVADEKEPDISRPAVVVSPNELNVSLPYVMIAPITSKIRYFPFRVGLALKNKDGQIALDQLQTVDKKRLVKKLGILPEASYQQISDILKQMFDVE